MGTWQINRPTLGPGIKFILAINIIIYVLELLSAYFLNFNSNLLTSLIGHFSLSAEGVLSGSIWQFFTYMWLHHPGDASHLIFNMILLFFVGPWLETQWGTKEFVIRYLVFGLGGGLLVFLTGIIHPLIFDGSQPPTLGASGAIAGVVAAFAFYHWRQTLYLFFYPMTGKTLLLIFIGIDILRILWGSPVAVQAHWGGMIAAAFVLGFGGFSPRRWWLTFRRWRIKRQLKLYRSSDSTDHDPHSLN
jgi:membrane associated rhomboid family serine protease